MWKTIKPVTLTLGGFLGIFILSALIFALTGCTPGATPEPVVVGPSEVNSDRPLADRLTYHFQKVDGSAKVDISFQSGWSCESTEGNCIIAAVTYDCSVDVASADCDIEDQHSFIVGKETVAREEIIGGLSTLRLIVTPGWMLNSWEWGSESYETFPVEVQQPTIDELDTIYQEGGLPEGPVRYFLVDRATQKNKIMLTYEESSNWSCASFTDTVAGVGENLTNCVQLVGTQTMFFYGLNKVGEEELIGGFPTGRLVIDPGYVLVAWNVVER